jgi:hypothetical protein
MNREPRSHRDVLRGEDARHDVRGRHQDNHPEEPTYQKTGTQ